MRDWSFLEPRYAIEIETHAASLLPSAQARFVVQDGVLWLYAMATADFEYPWVRRLRDVDPGVTIGVDGKLYPGRAVWSATRTRSRRCSRRCCASTTWSRPRGRASSRVPERFPGTQIRHWFFRVDPAPR